MIESDIIIIGGGAAGLMAARAAAAAGASTLVLEKMPRPARKIMITGKGRCNFTNVKGWPDFSLHVHPKANALRPAFYNLTPQALMELLRSGGLECVVERGDRAFPASHKAADVVDTLVSLAKKSGARISCESEVSAMEKDADGFRISTVRGLQYHCKKLIVTTGGLSYPTTGSSGDGYRFASSMGHKVTRLYPSLTALTPVGGWQKYQGRSMKNVTVSLLVDRQKVQEEFGDVDFTDGGIEGPMGFKLSRRGVVALENGGKVAVEIKFKDEEKPLHFDIENFVGWRRSVVTNGGIPTDEIIPKTMESRLVSGLYFAGEVLDLDADTGGYNLHIAFCTGALAGECAAKSL